MLSKAILVMGVLIIVFASHAEAPEKHIAADKSVTDVLVKEGGKVSLNCSVSTSKFRWYRLLHPPDQEVLCGEKENSCWSPNIDNSFPYHFHKVGNISSLTIYKTMIQHTGYYQARELPAENDGSKRYAYGDIEGCFFNISTYRSTEGDQPKYQSEEISDFEGLFFKLTKKMSELYEIINSFKSESDDQSSTAWKYIRYALLLIPLYFLTIECIWQKVKSKWCQGELPNDEVSNKAKDQQPLLPSSPPQQLVNETRYSALSNNCKCPPPRWSNDEGVPKCDSCGGRVDVSKILNDYGRRQADGAVRDFPDAGESSHNQDKVQSCLYPPAHVGNSPVHQMEMTSV